MLLIRFREVRILGEGTQLPMRKDFFEDLFFWGGETKNLLAFRGGQQVAENKNAQQIIIIITFQICRTVEFFTVSIMMVRINYK